MRVKEQTRTKKETEKPKLEKKIREEDNKEEIRRDKQQKRRREVTLLLYESLGREPG